MQSSSAKPLGLWGRVGAAMALSAIAGFVDAVGYVLLLHVYTSHMTGNTASLGRDWAGGEGFAALRHMLPLTGFMVGLMVGAVLLEWARRQKLRSRIALVLAPEIALLGVLLGLLLREAVGWGGVPVPLLIALPAAAMGLQTMTVTRIGDLHVSSTYITGTLSQFAQALAAYLFWLRDDRPAAAGANRAAKKGWRRQALRHRELGHAAVTALLWACFLAGALGGAESQAHWGARCLIVALGGLAAILGLDLVRPIVGDAAPARA